MLQKGVVEEKTFRLMKSLMAEDMLSEFFLVGGTALALKLGHRKSIDIDLFTRNDIPVDELQKYLTHKYGFKEEFREKNTLKGEIDGVKVDLIKYDYPFVNELEKTSDGIRMASVEDIIAMKLSAITDSGTRIKDFADIAWLSTRYSLNQMLKFYQKKFKGANALSVAKALVYFNDIDFENEPVELVSAIFDWKKVNKRLLDMVQNPDKVFTEFPIAKREMLTNTNSKKKILSPEYERTVKNKDSFDFKELGNQYIKTVLKFSEKLSIKNAIKIAEKDLINIGEADSIIRKQMLKSYLHSIGVNNNKDFEAYIKNKQLELTKRASSPAKEKKPVRKPRGPASGRSGY